MNAEWASMTETNQTTPESTAPAPVRATAERVPFSLGRTWTIAEATFTEAVRQKVFNFLLLAGLIFIASSSFFSQYSFGEQLKSVKDTCLGAISVLGTLIAIVGTAMLLPNEVEN